MDVNEPSIELEDLPEVVKKRTAHADIYFVNHVEPVAKKCRTFAPVLGADRLVCYLGGLLHDIGYTENYDSKQNHIANGIVIARQLLEDTFLEVDDKKSVIDSVVDCIRTHDGNLTAYSPIENRVVNDVDCVEFFKHPKMAYMLFRRFGFSPDVVVEKLKVHAKKNMENIDLDYFRSMGEDLYPLFLENLEKLREDGNF